MSIRKAEERPAESLILFKKKKKKKLVFIGTLIHKFYIMQRLFQLRVENTNDAVAEVRNSARI